MKSFKHFAAVAMTVVIAICVAGCQKETPLNGGVDGGEGTAAKLGLSFTVPTSSTPTRAPQDGVAQAALAAESAIQTVDVYIFKSTGVKAATGAHTRFALADFTEAPAGTFTLKSDKLIETLSGDNARVYVGANLGSAFNAEFADESALLARSTDVDSSSLNDPGGEGSIYQANNFTMFGNAVAVVDLKPYVTTDPNSVTRASIQLERVAAKVVVTAIGPDIHNTVTQDINETVFNWSGVYTVKWGELEARNYNAANFEEVEISYTFWGYTPVQNARQTYVVPNFLSAAEAAELPFFAEGQDYTGKHKTYAPWNGSLWTLSENIDRYELFEHSPGSPDSQRAVYTGTTPVADVNTLAPYWYYIGESRDYATPSAGGRSTYMMVTTFVGVNRQAVYDNGTDGIYNTEDDGGIYYTEEGLEGGMLGNRDGSGSTIWVVKNLKTDRIYITANGDLDEDGMLDGNQIAGHVARTTEGWVEGTSDMDEFVAIYGYNYGFVHFPIYLDGYTGPHATDRYGIFRNQFLHVNITGVFGAPGAFPGYPGNIQGDPQVDPNNPNDPNNPYPKDPTVPIDGSPSMLMVEFRVQPWYYLIKDGVILQ